MIFFSKGEYFDCAKDDFQLHGVLCCSLRVFPDVFSNPGLLMSDTASVIQIPEIRCKL